MSKRQHYNEENTQKKTQDFIVNSFETIQTKYYLKLNADQIGLKCNVSDSIKHLQKRDNSY